MDRTQAWSFRSLLADGQGTGSLACHGPVSQSLPVPAGSLWASVVRVGVIVNPSYHGRHARGRLQDRKSFASCPSSYGCPGTWPARYLCSCFLTDFQRGVTQSQDHTPRPDCGPVLPPQGGGKEQLVTQEAGSPHIWPRRLGLTGALCPSAPEMACLGLPRPGLSQPHLEKTLFI